MINKITASIAEALADTKDGAIVMIGGFGDAGQPTQLINGLIAQGARDLTMVNNNDFDPIMVGCVSRIYSDFAVVDITPTRLQFVDIVDGLLFDIIQKLSDIPLNYKV